MGETKYASAVAAIRAMECTLLSQSDIERMADADNLCEISEFLVSCGRSVPNNNDELLHALEYELLDTWNFIKESAPNCKEIEILLYRNNFYNLKAALKALIMNEDASHLFILPTSLKLDELTEVIAAKRYEELPEYMRSAAESAYNIITQSLDGQLAEAVIDTACLKAMTLAAEKYKSDLMLKYARTLTALSDIKTAHRCSIMKKSRSFLQIAVCGSPELDKDSLINAALGGTENLLSFLDNSHFSESAEMLRVSPAAFEKHCDDKLMEIAEDAKMQSFGAAPLEAYYIAKETEIKNLRILTVCKNCGIPKDIIMERMRKSYV